MTILPYGSWPSLIDAQQLVSQSLELAEPRWDNGNLYWLEFRPAENGRNCLLKRTTNGEIIELFPQPMSSRTHANEYGGGSYCVCEGKVYFVLADDQRIYQLHANAEPTQPTAITPEGPYRYADLVVNTQRNEIICVRETHHPKNRLREETTELVAINCDTSETTVLASGDDFYSSPQLSLDNSKLCWLSWNHPAMPWESTNAYIANFDEGGLLTDKKAVKGIAAGDIPQSIFQPRWSPKGELILVSDADIWWRFYKLNHDGSWHTLGQLDSSLMNSEFATPQWVFGLSTWDFFQQ